jgi:hypothetical protein
LPALSRENWEEATVVLEAARKIAVRDEVDVLVAGGGVSGCAAAIAAGRAGARTMLVERGGSLGGVATSGLMANIGNLFLDRDGHPVIHGIAREVVERMAARGAASARWASREVPGVVIDSEQLKVLLVEMLDEAGVQVLTHVLAARPVMGGSSVEGLFVESKVGREAVLAMTVVDATGEADIARQTGCPMRWTDGSASVEFKMARVDLEALYVHFRRQPETFPVGMDMVAGFGEFERNWVERGIFFFPHGGGRKWDVVQDALKQGGLQRERGVLWGLDATGLYGLRDRDWVIVNSNFWSVTTLDPREVTKAELEAQQACYYVADFFRRRVPGFGSAYVVQLAAEIGVRVSHGIAGRATLTEAHTRSQEPVRFADAIGRQPARASFPDTGEFFQSHTFDIPYGILLPRDVEKLLVGSGKSVSCQPQRLVRGMSGCMVVGQAAGAAAALSSQQGVPPGDVDVTELQRLLQEQGVVLGDDGWPKRLA